MFEACYPLENGEILHKANKEWPLFILHIYGSNIESLKISKRIMCSLKHLPLRLQVFYNHNTLKAIEEGCGKDPCVKMNGKILFEGLIQAEAIRNIFEKL